MAEEIKEAIPKFKKATAKESNLRTKYNSNAVIIFIFPEAVAVSSRGMA